MIVLNPVFKQMIWGGNRMREEYGYTIPGDDTGECWAISAHPSGDCVVKDGPYQGMHLSTLWREKRELFGNMDGEVFPLLTKIIDARDDLSIQVHPDDDYARERENGSLGKTECWYVLDCKENATIVIGHNAESREELQMMVRENRWGELIREIPIKKGDFFQINPGTVHAIKGGTLILETQQNSDITYRLYDYDRLKDGKRRPLHMDKSLDVIAVPFEPADADSEKTSMRNPFMTRLVACPYYTVWKAEIHGRETMICEKPFMLGSLIEGTAVIDGSPIGKGTHFILESGTNEVLIEAEGSFIFSAPGNEAEWRM